MEWLGVFFIFSQACWQYTELGLIWSFHWSDWRFFKIVGFYLIGTV